MHDNSASLPGYQTINAEAYNNNVGNFRFIEINEEKRQGTNFSSLEFTKYTFIETVTKAIETKILISNENCKIFTK